MSTIRWMGDAPNIAQVERWAPATDPTNQMAAIVGRKRLTVPVAAGNTRQESLQAMVDGWNDSDIAELSEVTAELVTDEDGEQFVQLTADTAGKPFTVTLATPPTITVAHQTRGSRAISNKSRFTIMGRPGSAGTFEIDTTWGTTATISRFDDPAEIQAKLGALAGRSPADFIVTGHPGDWTVEVAESLAGTNPAFAIASPSLGSGAAEGVAYTWWFPEGATGGYVNVVWDLGSGAETSTNIAYGATAAEVKDAIVNGMASMDADDLLVVGAGTVANPFVMTLVGSSPPTPAGPPTINVDHLTGGGAVFVTTLVEGGTVTGTGITVQQDTFTDTNGTLLTAHTPDTGSTAWTADTDPGLAGGGANIDIQSNKASFVAATGAQRYLVMDSSFAPDVDITAVINGSVTGEYGRAGVIFRSDGDGNFWWAGLVGGTSNPFNPGDHTKLYLNLIRFDAGVETPIAYAVGQHLESTDYTISIRCVGDSIKVTTNLAGTPTIEVTNATHSSNHRYGVHALCALSSTASFTIDTLTISGLTVTDEKWSIYTNAPAGTFTLTKPSGGTTSAISATASSATVAAALASVYGSGFTPVSGVGTGASPWVIEASGGLANTNLAAPTGNGANLAGIYSITVYVTSTDKAQTELLWTTPGRGFTDEVQVYVVRWSNAGDHSFTMFAGPSSSAVLSTGMTAAQMQSALEAMPEIGSGNVQVISPQSDAIGSGFVRVITLRYKNARAGFPMALLSLWSADTTLTFDSPKTVQDGGLSGSVQTIWMMRLPENARVTGNVVIVEYNNLFTGEISFPADSATLEVALQAVAPGCTVLEASTANTFFISVPGTTIEEPKVTGSFGGPSDASIQVLTWGGAQDQSQVNQLRIFGTGGTFTVTIDDQTTAAVAYNVSAANLQTALENLSNVAGASADVTVSGAGTDTSPYVITWVATGAWGYRNVPITINTAALTGAVVRIRTLRAHSTAVNAVQTVTLVGATGGTFTAGFETQSAGIAYNASAGTFESTLETALGGNYITVSGTAPNFTITFNGGPYAGVPLGLLSFNAESLTGGETWTQAIVQRSRGAAHADDPVNYSGGALPVSGDTLVFGGNGNDCLWGLTALQDVATLAGVVVEQSYTGRIGLSPLDTDGSPYVQYRQSYLKVKASLLTIGEGDGQGSSRLKFDCQGTATVARIYDSGVGQEPGYKAIQLLGTNFPSINVTKGEVDIARERGEVSTITTLNVSYDENQDSDSNVRCGPGVTLTTVRVEGGTVELNSAVTTLTAEGGTVRHMAGAVTTLNLSGGTCDYRSSGTITTATVGTDSTLTFARDLQARTITNAVQMFKDSELLDPHSTVTFSAGIKLNGCRLEDVDLDVGKNRTVSVS